MRIRMIATDLDGTLLRRDKTISAYTAQVFSRLRERGIKVLFATGRPGRTTTGFAEMIMPHGVIQNNGAGIEIADTTIFESHIAPAAVKAIVETLRGRDGVKLWLDYSSHSVTDHGNYLLWGSFEPVHACDFSEYDAENVQKIAIEAMDASMLASIDFDALGCWIHGTVGEPWYMVMANGVSKLSALKTAAAHFDIGITEVAAFGDDENDIDMLQGCGIGIAMENAIDEVKAVADHICGSNEDDGVAKWLEANVLCDDHIAGRAVCALK